MPMTKRLLYVFVAILTGILSPIYSAALGADTHDLPQTGSCKALEVTGNGYTVCRFHADHHKIQTHYLGKDGEPLGTFSKLASHLDEKGGDLTFAMNAGMYDKTYAPVGFYVEHGVVLKSANQRDGPGNFHLKPNGIFAIIDTATDESQERGRIGVIAETGDFLERYAPAKITFATQSGPMLVIDGQMHPRFLQNSKWRNRRNGVGVSADQKTIWFVISDRFVTFHEFGSVFRDHLKVPNALFLDGSISKLFAQNMDRHDRGRFMGPMIGVHHDRAPQSKAPH